MADVWVVETGDYEQRGVVGVFATEDLATGYCAKFDSEASVTRHSLWEREPQPVTYYQIQSVHGPKDSMPVALDWPRVAGGWRERRQYESNEVYVEHAAQVWVDWWSHRGPAVVVVAEGHDKAGVEALHAERWQAVLDGFRPDDDGRDGRG